MLEYVPFPERTPDLQYRQLLKRILDQDEDVVSQQEEDALMVFGHQMRFPLKNGFPIIPERDLVSASKGRKSIFEQALGELAGFLNGARTQSQLEKFGCSWWALWVTPEKCTKRGLEPGDLGPGSYGAAWRDFPTPTGSFDQFKNFVEQIIELPHLRTHFVSPWIPQYIFRGRGKQQKVVVVPCHGWLHVHVNTNTKKISLHHFQRSADVPVGLVSNLIQYAALLMMLGQVTGFTPKELVYTISNAHIFKGQISAVEELLNTTSQAFPTVVLDPTVTNLFDFRSEHFQVSDYHPQLSRRKIWTPV